MQATKPFQLRLPVDAKLWLATQAKVNGSSQNSEVIRAIRLAMAVEARKLVEPDIEP